MDSDATHAKESKFNKMCKSKLDLVIEKNSHIHIHRVIFIKGYCTTTLKCTTNAKLYSSRALFNFILSQNSAFLHVRIFVLALWRRWRNSRSKMFFKTVILKNFIIFPGKHLCWSLFLIKLLA